MYSLTELLKRGMQTGIYITNKYGYCVIFKRILC